MDEQNLLAIKKNFLSKSSNENATTIEDILNIYKIEPEKFWIDVQIWSVKNDCSLYEVLKIKNRERKAQKKQNEEYEEIYQALKEGTKTFGEVAKERDYTVDQIYNHLQNAYLTRIPGFSFAKLEEQNLSLLRQKPEFEIYFYFRNHNVTFQTLSTIFHKTEEDIIFYFDSTIASEIPNAKINECFGQNKEREIEEQCKKLYAYYEKNFLLFRDLMPIFNLTENEMEQCLINRKNKTQEWKRIKTIEQDRQKQIEQTIEKLNQLKQLIPQIQGHGENGLIETEIETLISDGLTVTKVMTNSQPGFYNALIKAIEVVSLYLLQPEYDIKQIKAQFQIKSRATEHFYFNHPVLMKTIDAEVIQYIRNKREIAHSIGLRNKQLAYLENQTYLECPRNNNGQFVKHYQARPTKE